jgi:hypothetical protein
VSRHGAKHRSRYLRAAEDGTSPVLGEGRDREDLAPPRHSQRGIGVRQTRKHLAQLGCAVGCIGMALNLAIVVLDRAAASSVGDIRLAAPALLYAFALWLLQAALSKQTYDERQMLEHHIVKTNNK